VEENTWEMWTVLAKFRNRLEQIIVEDPELEKLAYEYFCIGGDLEMAHTSVKTIQKQQWAIGTVFSRQDCIYKNKMNSLLETIEK
jgi:hypothetical protein